nr:hypothetical protein [Arthrobacter sp. JCM 19049]
MATLVTSQEQAGEDSPVLRATRQQLDELTSGLGEHVEPEVVTGASIDEAIAPSAGWTGNWPSSAPPVWPRRAGCSWAPRPSACCATCPCRWRWFHTAAAGRAGSAFHSCPRTQLPGMYTSTTSKEP